MHDLDAGIGLRGYGRVLRHGPALRPFLAALLGRLPMGMTSLGMVMLIEDVRGNYSIAGLVTGVFALATAFGAALWGRAMDNFGQSKVLAPTAIVSSLAIAAVSLSAVGGASNTVLIVLAAVAGVFFPPLSPAMRAAWRVIFRKDSSRRLGYALDASAVELIFVMGPLLLSLLAMALPAQWPLLVSAMCLAFGTVLYSLTHAARNAPRNREVRRRASSPEPWPEGPDPMPPPVPALASVTEGQAPASSTTALTAPGIASVLVVASCMAVGFGQLDTALIATADVVLGDTNKLGFLFLFVAGGSTIGGITYGAKSWPGDETWHLTGLLTCFTLSLVPWPFLLVLDHPPLPILFALLFITGLTIAPCLIIYQSLLDQLAPRNRMTEAQGLLAASQTTGVAAGTAVAGVTIDAWNAPGGVVGAIVALTLAVSVALISRRRWVRHT